MQTDKKEVAVRFPDFLIIGAAKSGTTSLYKMLEAHPRVYMPALKEPQFFSNREIHAQGLEWYQSLFAAAAPDQVCGEASTTYSRWPHTEDAAMAIAESLPEVKLIYIMRNPVDRAYSHYSHHMRLNVTKTFEEALKEDDIYTDCGMYYAQIQRYLRFFSKQQFLFLLFDDFTEDPSTVIEKICRFLDIPPPPQAKQRTVIANASGPDHYIRQRTTLRLRKLPGVSFIADNLPQPLRKFAYTAIKESPLGKRYAREAKLEPMAIGTRRMLNDLFSEPNRQLGEFLERDLSIWS